MTINTPDTPALGFWTPDNQQTYKDAITQLQSLAQLPSAISAPAAAGTVAVAAVNSLLGLQLLTLPTSVYPQLISVTAACMAAIAAATDVGRLSIRYNAGTEIKYAHFTGQNSSVTLTHTFVQPANTGGNIQSLITKIAGTTNMTIPANDLRFVSIVATCTPLLA